MSNKRRIRKRIEKSGIGVFVKADGSTQEFKISDDILKLLKDKIEFDLRKIELHTCQALLNFSRSIGKKSTFQGLLKTVKPESEKWQLIDLPEPLTIKPVNPHFFTSSFMLRDPEDDFRFPTSFFGENYVTQQYIFGEIIYTSNLIEGGWHYKMDCVDKDGQIYILGESRKKIDEQ
ncbi:hypothetical protein [Chryseobacterium sp.]|uniref:hypothetical protein n=1 Tax=Chryseobacterium sp. TaxID=1871047 RepID=UPI002896369D|nr:hypothetical protein [Chryseobacterium sp.]